MLLPCQDPGGHDGPPGSPAAAPGLCVTPRTLPPHCCGVALPPPEPGLDVQEKHFRNVLFQENSPEASFYSKN